MHRIEIRGAIVPNEYFPLPGETVTNLDAFGELPDDDVEIYISSVGGDVLTASEMMQRIFAWRESFPSRAITFRVGSLAASSAANIIAMCGHLGTVEMYPNSLIMFHGCYTLNIGGADSMRDTAERLEKVNEAVIESLAIGTNYAEADIRGWFRESREKWIGASEAVKMGVADRIASGLAEVEMPKNVNNTVNESIVAKFTNQIMEKLEMKKKEMKAELPETPEVQNPPQETPAAETPAPEETAPAPEQPAAECPTECPTEEQPAAECPTEQPEAECPGCENEEITALKAEIEELKSQIEELKECNSKLTAGLRVPATVKEERKTFMAYVKELNAKGLNAAMYAKAFEDLKTAHAEEFAEYMNSHQTR